MENTRGQFALGADESDESPSLTVSNAGGAGRMPRGSARVQLEAPIIVRGSGKDGKPLYEEAKTIAVNAQGGLLALASKCDVGQALDLTNPLNGKRLTCYVRSIMPGATGMHEVGVKFAAASPKFWGISSPPADWNSPEYELLQAVAPTSETPPQNTFGMVSDAPGPSSSVGADTPPVVTCLRRSTRIRIELPVDVHIHRENEQPILEHCKTRNVSAHGALIDLSTPVATRETLRLVNPRTEKEIECRVRRVGRRNPAGESHVSVEFVAVAPTFWDVATPPKDWDPAWVPPRERVRPEPSLPPVSSPQPPKKRGANDSSDDMGSLMRKAGEEIQQTLEATAVKSKPRGSRAQKWLMFSLAVAIVGLTVWTVMEKLSDSGAAPVGNSASSGISPEDASLIPRLERFRLATAADFDPDAVSWLHGAGQEASGKIPGAYSIFKESTAYILVGKDNSRRIVILADARLCYDAEFPVIAVAARVPKEFIPKISWADPSPPEYDGDGLLIVRAADAPASAVIIFLQGTRVVSGNPSDYRQIPLGQLP